VTEGQYVGAGSIISWSGSTGNSSGPHVHYETRINDIPVDPLTFGNRGYSTC
jgi:murein DD-endopeptidase MepM/ murein hydrolase activator NlpD